ncbi:hypothetical protein [Lysobacter humi (ex Lee et al. 2017)]
MQSENSVVGRVFGDNGRAYADLVSALVEETSRSRVRYAYLDPEIFRKLAINAPERAMHVYWHEMLGRAHLAATTSVLRAGQWLNGVAFAAEAQLYLPFCGNLRSLLEAAADSVAALAGVSQSLAEQRAGINNALASKPGPILISSEIENQLIHYSHARKTSKNEDVPANHAAATARSYLDKVERLGLPDAHAIYSRLCEISHPAAATVRHFLEESGEGEFVLTAHNDKTAIAHFMHEHQQFLEAVTRYAFNPSVVLLKVLLHLDATEYHSSTVARLDLGSMLGWQKCARIMGVV